MKKQNKTFILIGILFLAGGILLMTFPNVMEYVFSITSMLAGIVFFCIACKAKRAR